MTITKACTECGQGKMIQRFNRVSGSPFLGCDQYPECKATMPMPEYVKLMAQGAEQLPGFADA